MKRPTSPSTDHTFTTDDIVALSRALGRLARELPGPQAAMLELLVARAAAGPIERAALAGGVVDVPGVLAPGGHDHGPGTQDPAPFVALALGVGAMVMIGPKQDDPSRRGGAVMIGPKQDDPSPGRSLAMIGPKQDDPVKFGARIVPLASEAGLTALALRDVRFGAILCGERPAWLGAR
ncbi:MAG: hypothetical protein JNK64_19550 [Myxococcales bacterium]|nr:hypothetical protein [Myxococcales bacterium]